MCWQQNISDAGLANLGFCDHLESVDLLGTAAGDGVIAALAGKPKLRTFKTGRGVTDAGLALLHPFPAFKQWQGGDISVGLMSADAAELFTLRQIGPGADLTRAVAEVDGKQQITPSKIEVAN